MITIEYRVHALLLTNTDTGQQLALPLTDAPKLLSEVLEALGVQATRFQQGYRAGYIAGTNDGRQLGYIARDREYIIEVTKAQRLAVRAELAAICDEATAA